MFNNVGEKIKVIAVLGFVLGIIATIIGAIVAIGTSFLSAIGILIFGFFGSYLSVVVIYAFGELVENSTIIATNTGENLRTKAFNHPLVVSDSKYSDEYWKCSVCGKSNHKTAGTCGCGNRRNG